MTHRASWVMPLLLISACNGDSNETSVPSDASGADAKQNGQGTGGSKGIGGAGGAVSSSGGAQGRGGGSSSGGSSSGGSTGSGGAVGAGGAKGSGGATGAGGAKGTGGVTGSGGAQGTGGVIGSGGAQGTGGVTGSGGAQGTGGVTGSGGATGTGGSGSGTVSYSTNFNLTESPLSENGAWAHQGLDWTTVATSGGIAYGTQLLTPRSGAGIYNDSYAYLTTPFPANQTVSVVIHLPAGIDTTTSHEVEILLRWADGAHTARGYECNLSYYGGYAEIVRWNGALGSYTYVTPQGSGCCHAVNDGDVFKAEIVGNTITTYLNGVQLNTATDSMFATGQPGIGFYRGSNGAGSIGDYGFSSFTASSIP